MNAKTTTRAGEGGAINPNGRIHLPRERLQ
jgi:hypothetical protein